MTQGWTGHVLGWSLWRPLALVLVELEDRQVAGCRVGPSSLPDRKVPQCGTGSGRAPSSSCIPRCRWQRAAVQVRSINYI